MSFVGLLFGIFGVLAAITLGIGLPFLFIAWLSKKLNID